MMWNIPSPHIAQEMKAATMKAAAAAKTISSFELDENIDLDESVDTVCLLQITSKLR